MAMLLPRSLVVRAETIVQRKIIVVSPAVDDPRLGALRDGIAFWNDALVELGVDLSLIESELLVDSPHTRALENYTRQIWQQAGRQRSGRVRPDEPDALDTLGGDTIVFFSEQPTMSFAWPLHGSSRYFIAIPREPGSRRNRAGSTKNVIAHELGHALGLVHLRNPTVLMCSPCRTNQATTDAKGFLPLTDFDVRRLRSLYPIQ